MMVGEWDDTHNAAMGITGRETQIQLKSNSGLGIVSNRLRSK